MVVVGITKYPNITMTAINKGVVTVLNGQIHIGLRINSKRLLKRLLWHSINNVPIFMMIPITKNNSIFGLFYIINNGNEYESKIVARMVKEEDSIT